MGIVGSSSSSSCFFFPLVERWFIRVWSRCPCAVANDFGKCLLTASTVRPGQLMKCPLRMASSHVLVAGLKAAACRNWMCSADVELADVVDAVDALACCCSVTVLSFIGMSVYQRPGGVRVPVSTGLLL